MSLKMTHVAAASIVAAVGIPYALAQQAPGDQQATQGGAPLAFVRQGSSISADDHFIYVLGNGQITRVDKSTGTVAGQLTASGWSGQAGLPNSANGTTTNSAGGTAGDSSSGAKP